METLSKAKSVFPLRIVVVFLVGIGAIVSICAYLQRQSDLSGDRNRNLIPRTKCISNCKEIELALSQWAIDNKKSRTDEAPPISNLLGYLKGSAMPICPQGGQYGLGKTIADQPTCSLSTSHGHSL
jgi:hypothetical protein